jgi:16S rRNA (guanine527-N7)-methyltransferase
MDNLELQIEWGLRLLGIESDAQAVERLARHARAVLEANQFMNLTTISEAEFVPLHILDSLSALPYLSAEPAGSFADLGSGAGYPGIPLAIMTGRPVELVESVRKKAAFLEGACADLCLESTVHPIRAEELALTQPRSFNVVVARALSALPSLVELASPLLRDGGALICMKGRPDPDELLRGEAAAVKCGMVMERADAVDVPAVDAARTIVVYRKVGPARIKLPRRNGLAQRQPLA